MESHSSCSKGMLQSPSKPSCPWCVVMYLDLSDIRLVDGTSSQDDFSSLVQGNTEMFVLKGYTRAALVLGKGASPQQAMKEAAHFLKLQHKGTANDDDDSPNLSIASDPDTSDSDETTFDGDENVCQSTNDDNKISDELSLKCSHEPPALIAHKSNSTHETDIALSPASDSDLNGSREASFVSDVETYINGEPASHKLCGEDDCWEYAMQVCAFKQKGCDCIVSGGSSTENC